jgi:NAD(P)-dependent dehydrogenase (short-subunit alcohol dehydrogenase family)
VNCIAPSLTNTPMADKLINTPEKLESSNNRHPLKRIGEADDIANSVEFLLSEKSSWITGQILHVDGGMSTLKV